MMRHAVAAMAILLVLAGAVWAQTASTGTVLGVVTDASGAVVPGATVELQDANTGMVRTATTNEAGRYVFAGVQPGKYSMKASLSGFQPRAVPQMVVEVTRSFTVNFELAVGPVQETIEVTAAPGAELQMLDATVGGSVGGDSLMMLPTLSRNVTNLLTLQPTSMPQQGPAQNSVYGGQVAGARSDQNSIVLDGGNATNGISANSDYFTNFNGAQEGAIPTPVESIQEFRVTTSNQTASFSGAGGSETVLVTKRGSNVFHGSAYDFLKNDDFNANSWAGNRLGQGRPVDRDNRFGASLGGYIPGLPEKAKTYFYFNYEGRRLTQSEVYSRLVPTSTLRQGILRFRDNAGNIIQYNLATSKQCGTQGNATCDPRALGLNPVVNTLWSNYEPTGNDSSLGDGLNTIGFTAPLSLPDTSNFAVMRLDHSFGDKWQATASYRYYKDVGSVDRQVDVGGLVSGDKLGVPSSTAVIPRQPRYVVGSLTGVLSPTLTNEASFSYMRDYWNWATAGVVPQVSGTAAALLVGGNDVNGLIPVNLNTTGARMRLWNGHNLGLRDNLSWQKGTHLLRMGGTFNRANVQFYRDDGQVGFVYPSYYLDTGTGLNVVSAYRPPACSSTLTANCLPSSQNSTWNNLYAEGLGIVDQALVVGVRSGDLSALPPGTKLTDQVVYDSFSLYATDSWKITPTLTLNYGLNWSVDMPPTEQNGKQALSVTLPDNSVLIPENYLAQREKAALAGQVYNPTIGFSPIRATNLGYMYNAVYDTAAPRVALAWNPQFDGGIMGRIFGKGKTVFRGGYGQVFDRLNGVQKVGNALQGFGFQQTLTCLGPSKTGACLGTSGSDPSTAFRIGTDGSSVPLPSLTPTATPPLVPGVAGVPGANQAFANTTYQIDPTYRPGRNQMWNFTIQRELPGRSMLEVGYIGRHASNIYAPIQGNQVPFMMTLNGQSFAQAFNAMAANIKAGGAIAPQPFLEAALAGSSLCAAPNANCTAGVVSKYSGSITAQQVTNLWNGIQPSFVFGPATAATKQITSMFYWASQGWANYDAGFISYRTRSFKGLTFDTNLTYAHSLDTYGLNQDFDTAAANSFDLHYQYGNSVFDRKFVFNLLGLYEFPFGRKGTGPMNYIIRDWSIAPIFSYATGLPLRVLTGSSQEFGQTSSFSAGAVLLAPDTFGNNIHSGVAGNASTGVATNANPATKGTGLNLFADPNAVFNSFRPVMVGVDTTTGGGGQLRGLPSWNLDLSLSRKFKFSERASAMLSLQMFNTFNRVQFNDPTVNLQAPQSFGVFTTQLNTPRVIQWGLHFDF